MSSSPPCRVSATGLAVVLSLVLPALASAQSGSTLTPDRLTYVVNKDIGAERWTINLNFASLDPLRPINVTGNVYRSDGGSPSFVWCQLRDDSTGTLSDPNSVFRLRCSGASACGDTATGCARSQWQVIADPVGIPASFFLPDQGNGLVAARGASGAPAPARRAPAALGLSIVAAGDAPAGTSNRGTNLPPDGANFLVNKELGGARWSISLNQIPAQRGNDASGDCENPLDCIITSRFLNVTGNVYPLDGGAPQFVYCQERKDSAGDLSNPQSEFRFGCVGASPCEKTATACAEQDWQPIPGGADIRLQSSFFLPPGGLPATPQSDPEIVVIGRTSDPPAVVVGLQQGATTSDAATVQGGCSQGATCSVSIGSCGAVQGRIVFSSEVGCACAVEDVPPECIACGGGASGTCGGDCQYQAGGSTARGQCLPFSSTSGECACYAADQGDRVAISICGGSLGNDCPSGKCCTDDLRDGCDPASGDVDCAGICVDSNGCDPTVSQCGSCFDQREQPPLICGELEAPAGASCCADCPDGSTSCYCEPGRVCNLEEDGGGCCPTSRPDICNETSCIPSGANCCVDCPEGATNCFCAAGSLCVLEAEGGGCCPLELPVGCNGTCLPAGTECCADCPAGSESCWCEPGSLCIPESEGGGCEFCPAEAPVNCRDECLLAGFECCYDQFGGFCEPGFACVLGSDACRPLDSALGEAAQSRPRVEDGDGAGRLAVPGGVRAPERRAKQSTP